MLMETFGPVARMETYTASIFHPNNQLDALISEVSSELSTAWDQTFLSVSATEQSGTAHAMVAKERLS
jgi:multisubunit Na+/H+ antiporter MnhE subunit